jgi:DNA polymerase III alpha subunit
MLMKTDELGIPRFSNRDLIDMIYSGHADKVHVVLCDANDDVDKFNAAMEEQGFDKLQKYIPLDVDQKTFDGALQSEWFMPEEYKTFDLLSFLNVRVAQETGYDITDIRYMQTPEYARKEEELKAFQERGMVQLLRYMIYLVDFMRENDIVWGVGRGSSVASYVLYLIGVHRIDSIQYDLDWREFLR